MMKEKFAQFDQLLLIYLKRDWKKIIGWVLLLSLFGGAFLPAFEEITQGDGLLGMYYTMENPAMIAMVGLTPITIPENYTLGAMYAQQMLLFTALVASIVSALHVVAHTRKEEDSGIREIIQSFQVGRQANSMAVMLEVIFINSMIALTTTGILNVFDEASLNFEGTLLFGVSVGLAGILGATIALVLAQIMPTSGGAVGSSIGILGLLYFMRGITDIIDPAISEFNPMSWTYFTYPFTENNWLYPLLLLLFSAGLYLVALFLEGNRDLGTGYLPQRKGRERATRSLQSVPGLFVRLNRGMMISWLVAFFVMGLAYGSIFGDLQMFVESNELIRQMFAQENMSVEASFTGMISMVMAGLATILPIAVVNRLYNEEKELRLNQLFSTRVSRMKLYWVNIILAVLSGISGLFIGAIGLALSATMSMQDKMVLSFADFVGSSLSQLPYVLFFIGLAGLGLGLLPRFNRVLYIYLTFSFFVVYFKDLIGLPTWFVNTSIQSWLPQVPIEEFDITSFLFMQIVSIILMIVGAVAYNRRDLIEEG